MEEEKPKECILACTKVVKFKTVEAPPSAGFALPPYTEIDGYRHINILVRFDQEEADEPPVDLGVMFGFDDGTMAARCYVNLEANVSSPQGTQFIEVSGRGSWQSQLKASSYIARFPVMGPFVQVFLYNRASKKRKINVWAYLVS